MTLLEFKQNHRLSYAAMAKRLDVDRLILYRICIDQSYCPRLNVAYKIVRNSQGEVTLEDLLQGDC